MADPLILTETKENVILLLTLNRPEKRNALNIPLLQKLCEQFEQLSRERTIRVAILNGAGPVFCAGLDLLEMREKETEEKSAELIGQTLKLLYQAPFVTIAAVHGAAIAGGAGIMAACDLTIAASDCRIGFPEVRRGLVPAQILPILQRRLAGGALKELLLWGEIFEAEHALTLGLVNGVVPYARLMEEALSYARQILFGAPTAIRETKELIERLAESSLEQDLEISMPYHHRSRMSEEAAEGARAFFEKRNPSWAKTKD
jgi:methylglutaconyl-CoA hydratase